ncbi:hypothetical protein L1887_53797 [Cichorium endivia]|nr:hypothetical protein L1887_53797 [Cichorium endivia]
MYAGNQTGNEHVGAASAAIGREAAINTESRVLPDRLGTQATVKLFGYLYPTCHAACATCWPDSSRVMALRMRRSSSIRAGGGVEQVAEAFLQLVLVHAHAGGQVFHGQRRVQLLAENVARALDALDLAGAQGRGIAVLRRQQVELLRQQAEGMDMQVEAIGRVQHAGLQGSAPAPRRGPGRPWNWRGSRCAAGARCPAPGPARSSPTYLHKVAWSITTRSCDAVSLAWVTPLARGGAEGGDGGLPGLEGQVAAVLANKAGFPLQSDGHHHHVAVMRTTGLLDQRAHRGGSAGAPATAPVPTATARNSSCPRLRPIACASARPPGPNAAGGDRGRDGSSLSLCS